jgi:hypothetical protein
LNPELLKLANSLTTDYSLADICNSDGNNFDTEQDRKKFIRDYYASIYKVPECDASRGPNLIEAFLGADILEHPMVKNSKLSESERDRLDLPLSLSELDKSLKEANQRSAPGIDGFNMKFINKFWYLLRMPLFRYANVCFEKGILTPTFRSATVRLIPKKGDKKLMKKLASNLSIIKFIQGNLPGSKQSFKNC